MKLDDYLEATPDGLMVRGTRVDLGTVIDGWRDGLSAEEIAHNHPTLTLESVYAALAYYLANRAELDAENAALHDELNGRRSTEREAPVVARMRALLVRRSTPDAAG